MTAYIWFMIILFFAMTFLLKKKNGVVTVGDVILNLLYSVLPVMNLVFALATIVEIINISSKKKVF